MAHKTVFEIYKHLCTQLPELEARIILKERAGIDWATIISSPNLTPDDDTYTHIQNDLACRLSGKPLSRIYGMREFWGRGFKLNEDTLDPRPDSETLIEAALKHFKKLNSAPETILDLGTGSGCLLITLLCEFQGARGIGTDLSHGALAIAAPNATALGVGDRARFTVSNWLDAIDGTFDLIISNPPYIESDVIPDLEKDVRDFDPILALDGGKNGLQAYQNIFSKLKSALKSGGVALLEIGFDQDQSVMRLSEKYGLRTGALHRDLAGNPRVVEIFL